MPLEEHQNRFGYYCLYSSGLSSRRRDQIALKKRQGWVKRRTVSTHPKHERDRKKAERIHRCDPKNMDENEDGRMRPAADAQNEFLSWQMSCRVVSVPRLKEDYFTQLCKQMLTKNSASYIHDCLGAGEQTGAFDASWSCCGRFRECGFSLKPLIDANLCVLCRRRNTHVEISRFIQHLWPQIGGTTKKEQLWNSQRDYQGLSKAVLL